MVHGSAPPVPASARSFPVTGGVLCVSRETEAAAGAPLPMRLFQSEDEAGSSACPRRVRRQVHPSVFRGAVFLLFLSLVFSSQASRTFGRARFSTVLLRGFERGVGGGLHFEILKSAAFAAAPSVPRRSLCSRASSAVPDSSSDFGKSHFSASSTGRVGRRHAEEVPNVSPNTGGAPRGQREFFPSEDSKSNVPIPGSPSPVYRRLPPRDWQQRPRFGEHRRSPYPPPSFPPSFPPHSASGLPPSSPFPHPPFASPPSLSPVSGFHPVPPVQEGPPPPFSLRHSFLHLPPLANVLLPHRRPPPSSRSQHREAGPFLREIMDSSGDVHLLLPALRKALNVKALSDVCNPMSPLDLRPWLTEEKEKLERRAEEQSAAIAERGLLGEGSSPSGEVSEEENSLRLALGETLRQLQYLKELLYGHVRFLEERRPPPETLEFIERAGKGALALKESGVFAEDSDISALLDEAIQAREGVAASHALPPPSKTLSYEDLDARLRTCEVSLFPAAVNPVSVDKAGLDALRRLGVRPEWILGSGFGGVVKARRLGLAYGMRNYDDPPRYGASEVEQLFSPKDPLHLPEIPALEGDSPIDAAERRFESAQQRILGFSKGAPESPLSFFARMQRLLLSQGSHQQQRPEAEADAKIPAGPAGSAAAAFKLIQKARDLALPPSVVSLLQRYSHLTPDQMQLAPDATEHLLTALKDFEKFLFKTAQTTAERLVPFAAQLEQEKQREACAGKLFVKLEDDGDIPAETTSEVKRLAESWKADDRRFEASIVPLALNFVRRKLEKLEALRRKPRPDKEKAHPPGAAHSSSAESARETSSSPIVSLPTRKLPGRLGPREERRFVKEALKEAEFFRVVERALDNADVLSLENTELRGALEKVAPLTAQLQELHKEGKPTVGEEELLQLRERRVQVFLDEANEVFFRQTVAKMGSENAGRLAKGGPVIPGMMFHGKVISVTPQVVYIDVGLDIDATLHLTEVLLPLEHRPREGLHRYFKPGDRCSAVVFSTRPQELRLSLLPLRQLAAWEALARATNETRVFPAVLIGATSTGFVVDVNGIRGYLPASEVSDPSLDPLAIMQEPAGILPRVTLVRILMADIRQDRLFVSQRLAFANRVTQQQRIEPGSLFEGVVSDVLPFGVAVNAGLLRGLLHVREISSLRINPGSIFRVGQRIRAAVLSHNPASGRILLSTRQLEAFPGQMVANQQAVFDRAEAAAAAFREECRQQRTKHHSAAAQLLKTLGKSNQDAASAAAERLESERADTDFASELLEPPKTLWFGMDFKASPLMRYLEAQLEEAEAKEKMKELDNSLAKQKSASCEEDSLEAPLPPVRLPGGGSVRVRKPNSSAAKANAQAMAAALASVSALQKAIIASGFGGDIPRRTLPTVDEAPLDEEEWIFS